MCILHCVIQKSWVLFIPCTLFYVIKSLLVESGYLFCSGGFWTSCTICHKEKEQVIKKNDIVVHFQYLIVFLFYKQISKWPADVPPVKLKKCPVRHVKSIACTAKYFYLFVFFILSTIRANVSFYKNSNRSLYF